MSVKSGMASFAYILPVPAIRTGQIIIAAAWAVLIIKRSDIREFVSTCDFFDAYKLKKMVASDNSRGLQLYILEKKEE